MRTIDLNCDVGEGCPTDAEMLGYATSANIACGFHAGDVDTIARTVYAALNLGVAVGAHPGYRDRGRFGRVEMPLPSEDLQTLITDQLETFTEIACRIGAKPTHVKPHGALYNLSARDASTAEAIANAVFEFDPELILYGLAGSASITAAVDRGLRVAAEAFADRTYSNDGSLTPRSRPGALITRADVAARQAIAIALDGVVESIDGFTLPILADTICLHGDSPDAVGFAAAVRHGLEAHGIVVRSPL